jgi:hypothetical protein
MRTVIAVTSVVILIGVIVAGAVVSRPARAQGTARHPLVTKAEYERWQKELSNWGRWGKDDEMGTLNLITPAKRKEAAALVKDGVSVSLSSDESAEKSPDNPCPIEWSMLTATPSSALDRVGFPCIHGPGHTHLDSFAHDFDAVAEAAAARNRWEFMLTIAPLAIPHGTGSPVNPIAIF